MVCPRFFNRLMQPHLFITYFHVLHDSLRYAIRESGARAICLHICQRGSFLFYPSCYHGSTFLQPPAEEMPHHQPRTIRRPACPGNAAISGTGVQPLRPEDFPQSPGSPRRMQRICPAHSLMQRRHAFCLSPIIIRRHSSDETEALQCICLQFLLILLQETEHLFLSSIITLMHFISRC
jgi:hypothetical protein